MESHPVVYIRTDANQTVAWGHVMRCLTIAQELKHNNAYITFVFSDSESAKIYKRLCMIQSMEAFPYLILNSDYEHLEMETAKLSDILLQNQVNTIIVDSYYVSHTYLSTLKKICKLVYIDDVMKFPYPVDMVINYDLYPDDNFYSSVPVSLLGAKYAPLRTQFTTTNYAIHKDVKNIFISTGGTDPYDIPYQLLTLIKKEQIFPVLSFHIITTLKQNCNNSLSTLLDEFSNIHLYENVSNMASLMSQCDLAISAGGTTLYELCAIGIPTICYSMADNQFICAKDFAKAGFCHFIGDCRQNSSFFHTLKKNVLEYIFDYTKRKTLHICSKSSHIGNGASLIANSILHN